MILINKVYHLLNVTTKLLTKRFFLTKRCDVNFVYLFENIYMI